MSENDIEENSWWNNNFLAEEVYYNMTSTQPNDETLLSLSQPNTHTHTLSINMTLAEINVWILQ